jgi:hypothetical protein
MNVLTKLGYVQQAALSAQLQLPTQLPTQPPTQDKSSDVLFIPTIGCHVPSVSQCCS